MDRLLDGYRRFRAETWPAQRDRFAALAAQGQKPHTMIIACSDSRVDPQMIFSAGPGELFVVRNVANLVPPYMPDAAFHGTSAAVEYAVTSLGVAHIVVLGHSNCGGVKGCHDMCRGHAPQLEEKTSFVGRWMDILRPGFDKVAHLSDDTILEALEKQAVLTSLENLLTFPFVKSAVEDDRLTLHGLWNNTGEGLLETYDPARGGFFPV